MEALVVKGRPPVSTGRNRAGPLDVVSRRGKGLPKGGPYGHLIDVCAKAPCGGAFGRDLLSARRRPPALAASAAGADAAVGSGSAG
jgi:hypothetical protein